MYLSSSTSSKRCASANTVRWQKQLRVSAALLKEADAGTRNAENMGCSSVVRADKCRQPADPSVQTNTSSQGIRGAESLPMAVAAAAGAAERLWQAAVQRWKGTQGQHPSRPTP